MVGEWRKHINDDIANKTNKTTNAVFPPFFMPAQINTIVSSGCAWYKSKYRYKPSNLFSGYWCKKNSLLLTFDFLFCFCFYVLFLNLNGRRWKIFLLICLHRRWRISLQKEKKKSMHFENDIWVKQLSAKECQTHNTHL